MRTRLSDDDRDRPLTLWETAMSVLAAFFGVQTSAKRRRDFRHGRPLHFIVIGAVATALFVIILVVLVRVILAVAAP